MRGLTVLLTNFDLGARAGSQLYLRDVALGLLKRGHTPVAYSLRLGEVARELSAATVPVTDDLERITAPPDVIHGHHNHDLFTALLRFPGVPAVRMCHGWLEDAPQPFPRVLRYLAVDDTTRDRCVCEWGLPADRVDVLLNFVDLSTFVPRRSLPARPSRALVFSNQAQEHLWAVREACQAAGMSVDALGLGAGRSTAHPASVLPRYDIVFAKARCALEAMACGAAVVLCDGAGVGPMVTATEWPALRRLNFGIRTLREPVSPEAIAREIGRYDASDAREVTRMVVASAGADHVIETLVETYRSVMAEHERNPSDPRDELRAAARYLRRLTPRLQWLDTPDADRYAMLRFLYHWATSVPGARAVTRTRWMQRQVRKIRDRRWRNSAS